MLQVLNKTGIHLGEAASSSYSNRYAKVVSYSSSIAALLDANVLLLSRIYMQRSVREISYNKREIYTQNVALEIFLSHRAKKLESNYIHACFINHLFHRNDG